MRHFLLAFSVTLSVSRAATAKQVPVDIYWGGAAPSQVLVNVPGGMKPLQRDGAAMVFRGTMSLPDGSPERRTIIVRYGSYSHPFDIRVHRGLSRVTFFVSHTVQGSCTHVHVSQARAISDNLADAVSRSVAAGELISISEPNACNDELRFTALQARFQQNAAMTNLSNGFFLMNREIEREYKREALARGLNVDTELAQYTVRERSFEARQLAAFRTAAQAVGNYPLALNVNDLMAKQISSDPKIADFYRQQGLTAASVAAYGQTLQIEAAAQRDEALPKP